MILKHKSSTYDWYITMNSSCFLFSIRNLLEDLPKKVIYYLWLNLWLTILHFTSLSKIIRINGTERRGALNTFYRISRNCTNLDDDQFNREASAWSNRKVFEIRCSRSCLCPRDRPKNQPITSMRETAFQNWPKPFITWPRWTTRGHRCVFECECRRETRTRVGQATASRKTLIELK